MPRLLWDQPGERLYETGLDRGVLYLKNRPARSTAVPWNGLTAVDEDLGEESTNPVYVDGIKFIDQPTFSDYAATLRAITYPDEFHECEGFVSFGEGVFADDQPVNMFDLSYRTLVGNDTESDDFGYLIHIVYNLTAVPEAKSHNTFGETIDPAEFGWSLSGVPEELTGYRPTSHIMLDSRYIDENLLERVEDILYGSAEEYPRLPTMSEWIELLDLSTLITIIDNEDGTWSAIGPDELITMLGPSEFQITEAPATYLDEVTYQFSNAVIELPTIE